MKGNFFLKHNLEQILKIKIHGARGLHFLFVYYNQFSTLKNKKKFKIIKKQNI